MVTLKHIAAGVVASVFVIAITVDSADARRGGGGAGGGFANAGSRRAHVSQPIARPGLGNRPGNGPGWGNNRPGAGNPGWGRPGYGWGAAAVGAGLAYSSSYNDGYYGGYYNDASYVDTSDAAANCAAPMIRRARLILPVMADAFVARSGEH